MKNIFFIVFFTLICCSKKQEVYAPVSQTGIKKQISVSHERAKNLNLFERDQIQSWIAVHEEKFYEMPMNYWVNIQNLKARQKRSAQDKVSYLYELYDFEGNPYYSKPKGYRDVVLGKFPNELRAVEDAMYYLKAGETATLLVPSVLAFGTYGDGDKIKNDVPLVIKLKTL